MSEASISSLLQSLSEVPYPCPYDWAKKSAPMWVTLLVSQASGWLKTLSPVPNPHGPEQYPPENTASMLVTLLVSQ